MAQTFLNLPMPVSGNGPGAAVAIPASSPHKTFGVAGNWRAFAVTLEISANGTDWDKVAFFNLNKNAPQTLTVSMLFARVNVRGLLEGSPVATLAVDTVTGLTQSANLPFTGAAVDISAFENKHKTFIVSAKPENLDGVVVVYGSADGSNFEPLFKAQGQDRSSPYSFDGFLKFAKAVPLGGETAGMRVDVVVEPFTCGQLIVTDIVFNNNDSELEPGYPDPSTWCADVFTNPPVITITFNAPIDPASVTVGSVFLTDPASVFVPIGPFTFSAGNTKVSFTPLAPLATNVVAYNVHVTAAVMTPGAVACEPVLFPVEVESCAVSCENLVYGGSYPDTFTAQQQLYDNTVITSFPRHHVIPAISKFAPGPNVLTPARWFFLIGGITGDAPFPLVSTQQVNVYRWNGLLIDLDPANIPALLNLPNPLGLLAPPAGPLVYGLNSSISGAVTDNNCNVFVNGIPSNVFIDEGGNVFYYGFGPARMNAAIDTWSMASLGTTADDFPRRTVFPSALATPQEPVNAVSGDIFLLNDGRILYLRRGDGFLTMPGRGLIYDPVSGNVTVTAPYPGAPTQPSVWDQYSAVKMADGKILVSGGMRSDFAGLPLTTPVAFSAIYDPVGDSWAVTGSMNNARREHTLILLDSGRVLAVGGTSAAWTGLFGSANEWNSPVGTAEIYDPGSGTWSNIGVLATPRVHFSSVKLPTGEIFVIGGIDSTGTFLSSTEVLGASLLWQVGPALPVIQGCADSAAIVIPHPTQYTVVVGGGRAGAPGFFGSPMDIVFALTNPTGGAPPFGGPPL